MLCDIAGIPLWSKVRHKGSRGEEQCVRAWHAERMRGRGAGDAPCCLSSPPCE